MSSSQKATKQEIVKEIVDHVLERVLPEQAVRHCFKVDNDTLVVEDKKYNLNDFKKIIIKPKKDSPTILCSTSICISPTSGHTTNCNLFFIYIYFEFIY